MGTASGAKGHGLLTSVVVSFASELLTNIARAVVRRRRRGPHHPAWGHRLEAAVETLRAGGEAQLRGTLEAWRAGQEAAAALTPIARGMAQRDVVHAGMRAIELTPTRGAPSSSMLYLHGGGYVTGSSRTHRGLASRIALAANARAIVLDYRLAPEHPFPAALEDALAACQAMEGPYWICGDSAGGGLALAAMCALRDRGAPLPTYAVLLCPWVDMEGSHPSIEENVRFDWGDRRTLDFYASHYASHDKRDPRVSPIHASLVGLPPMLVQWGDAELLRDECRQLVANARRDGVAIEPREWHGMVHDFQIFAPFVPQSRAAIAEIGELARRHAGR